MPHPYNTTYTQPFPTLPLVIKSKAGTATKSLPALVDTGADGTLVPIAHLQKIGADRADLARLRSHWGEWRSVVTYLVDLEVAGELLPAIEVVGDDQGSHILLGRNLTNKLILLLDGPRQQSDVLTRRPRRLSIAEKP